MQKAPVMKGSGLKPLDDGKGSEEVHVFGRNLEERVVNNDEQDTPSISFHNIQDNQETEDDIDSIRKRKFDAITGEEDEETIFQGDFKLFVWDITSSNWIEKGRGQLKLNDSLNQDEKKSRLIMRVNGTLRIILNVSIRNSYFRVLANSKTNIRFTDSRTVWAASGSNANQLKDLIEERLKLLIEEESELRKKAKSDDDDKTSLKKNKADDEEPSPSNTSESKSTQETSTEDSGDEDRLNPVSEQAKLPISEDTKPKDKDTSTKNEHKEDENSESEDTRKEEKDTTKEEIVSKCEETSKKEEEKN